MTKKMTKKAWIIIAIISTVLAASVAVGVIIALQPHKHKFGEGTVTVAPTCTEGGSISYTCSSCGEVKTEALPPNGHSFSEWQTLVEHTPNIEGLERRDCSVCGFYEERTVDKVPSKYHITIDKGLGGLLYWGVAEDGVYSLEDPIRVGYKFIGWKDADGNPFASEGVISSDVKIFAQWELLDTNTLAELCERAAGGADLIRLTSDITIDSPIFVTGKTRIFSEKPIKLTRAKNYNGDLFVVGQTENDESSIVKFGKAAELSLGKDDWTADNIMLTVDGNRDNTEVDVVGSAFFLVYSGNLNMYDGVAVINHNKVGNERSYNAPEEYIGTGKTIGGAVAIVGDGSAFHMYGGVIENNSVNTTSTTDENGEAVNLSAYGGVIYNNGTVRIHNGTVSNNQANRGGFVYSNGVLKIYAGVFENNYAGNKGGAICTSGSLSADTYISSEKAAENTVVFRGNYAGKQGGAILSYYNSPIVIYDGVLFENNRAESGSGGAISTSGPVTAYNTKFIGNTAKSYGGSIYHAYAGSDAVRQLLLNGCTFDANEASSGGAIMLASSSDSGIGSYAELTNCIFTGNKATSKSGVGGAVNVTDGSFLKDTGSLYEGNTAYKGGAINLAAFVQEKKDTVLIAITGSTFKSNKADKTTEESDEKSRGGAIHVGEYATVEITNATFEENFCAQYGGSIDVARSSTLKLNGSTFTKNSSTVNGGAIWSYTDAVLNIGTTEFNENTTGGYGGAVYAYATLNIVNSKFVGNTAEVGGAVYTIAGATVENSEFKKNSATSNGGAICLADGAVLTDTSSLYEENIAQQGGAIYITYDKENKHDTVSATVNRSIFRKNTATGAEKSRGGAIYIGEYVTVNVNAVFEENTADQHGGAISVARGSALDMEGSTFKKNTSGTNGGAIWVYEDATININTSEFTENTTDSYGGSVYVGANTNLNINKSAFAANSAQRGGAIYASSVFSVTESEFTSNDAVTGGAIYAVKGVNATDSEFKNNTVHLSDVTSTKAVYLTAGSAIYAGSASKSTVSGCTFDSNTAYVPATSASSDTRIYGAAICAYGKDTDMTVSGSTFNNNGFAKPENAGSYTAKTYGGAIGATQGATVFVTGASSFSRNSAMYGGAFAAATNSQSKVGVDTATFTENTATNCGGAIYLNATAAEIKNVVANKNSANSTGGGAIYASGCSGITVEDSVFEENTTGNAGGAFSVSTAIDIKNTTFAKNEADKKGGAIYASSTVNVYNCIFTENTSASGGAICVNSGTTSTVGCTFTNNTATTGGAINVSSGTLTVTESAFTENKATKNGGAINMSNEDTTVVITATITDSDFTENEAGTRGGAITAENVMLTVNGGTMKENKVTGGATSSYYGGALDARAKTQATVTGTVFDGNVAYSGGAISSYATGTSVTLNQVELKNNVGSNGAIYIGSEASVTVTDLNAHDNATKSKGAVFYMTSGLATTLTVNSATLSNNTANKAIGFIFISNAKNVLNINKSKVSGSDVNNNWDKLILNDKGATVNEITEA